MSNLIFLHFTPAKHPFTGLFPPNNGRQRLVCVWQISQQVDALFEHTRLRNKHRFAFCLSKNHHLLFPPLSFFLIWALTHAWQQGESTAPKRGKGPEWLAGGGGTDNNAAFLSPGEPASQFWLRIRLASALHRLGSAQPSPKRCAMVRYRATQEGVKLPARTEKIMKQHFAHNQLQPRLTLDSCTPSIFDTFGHFCLCTPTHWKCSPDGCERESECPCLRPMTAGIGSSWPRRPRPQD